MKKLELTGLILALGSFLSGCNDGNSGGSQALTPISSKYAKMVHISGLVRNEKKHITGGKIAVKDFNSAVIAKTEIDKKAHYAVDIPANTDYPIEIIAYPGKGQSDYKRLRVAVIIPPRNLVPLRIKQQKRKSSLFC